MEQNTWKIVKWKSGKTYLNCSFEGPVYYSEGRYNSRSTAHLTGHFTSQLGSREGGRDGGRGQGWREREREINAVAQLTSSFCLFYSVYDFSCKTVLSTFYVDPLYSVKSPWKCSHGHKQRLVFLNPVKYSMKINHDRCSAAGA